MNDYHLKINGKEIEGNLKVEFSSEISRRNYQGRDYFDGNVALGITANRDNFEKVLSRTELVTGSPFEIEVQLVPFTPPQSLIGRVSSFYELLDIEDGYEINVNITLAPKVQPLEQTA
jgi:hypothetical protein